MSDYCQLGEFGAAGDTNTMIYALENLESVIEGVEVRHGGAASSDCAYLDWYGTSDLADDFDKIELRLCAAGHEFICD